MKDYAEFSDALKSQVIKPETHVWAESLDETLKPNFDALKKLATARQSTRKFVIMGLIEREVRREFNLEGKIDWANIDWSAVLLFILKLLITLLPLLLMI